MIIRIKRQCCARDSQRTDFEGCIWKKGAVQWPRAARRLGHMPKPKGRARACLLTHLGSFRNTRHSSYTQTSKHGKLACIHSMEVHQCLLRKRKGWLSKCSTCKLCLLGFIMGVHSYKCAYALEDIYFLLLLMIFMRECGGENSLPNCQFSEISLYWTELGCFAYCHWVICPLRDSW